MRRRRREQFINAHFRPDTNDPAACKGKEIGDQMMWLEQMGHGYLGNLRHHFKYPLTPMKYHIIPSPPLDGPAADGGNFDRAYRAPLAERPWVSVGGKSGAVHVHIREQGRPQGASFSAGDLSRRLKR